LFKANFSVDSNGFQNYYRDLANVGAGVNPPLFACEVAVLR